MATPIINPSRTPKCLQSQIPDGTGWTPRTSNQPNPNAIVSNDGCWERPKAINQSGPEINPSKLPKCLQSAMPEDDYEWTRKTTTAKAAGHIESPDGCWERPLNRPAPRTVRANDTPLKPETPAKQGTIAIVTPKPLPKSEPAAPATITPEPPKLDASIKVLIALIAGTLAGAGTKTVLDKQERGAKKTVTKRNAILAGTGVGAATLAALYFLV